MLKPYLLVLLMLYTILVLSGCSAMTTPKSHPVSTEDFVLTLYSDKATYNVGEKVMIEAELMYVGEHKQITIGHAASPIQFTMYEQTREIGFLSIMDQPYIKTILRKNVPVKYELSGLAYSNELNNNKLTREETVQFSKAIVTMNLLEGVYTIKAKASFQIDESKFIEISEYTNNKEITIEVKK